MGCGSQAASAQPGSKVVQAQQPGTASSKQVTNRSPAVIVSVPIEEWTNGASVIESSSPAPVPPCRHDLQRLLPSLSRARSAALQVGGRMMWGQASDVHQGCLFTNMLERGCWDSNHHTSMRELHPGGMTRPTSAPTRTHQCTRRPREVLSVHW